MNKEEAIKYAECLKNNYTVDFDKLPEFCDMAISALKGGWIPVDGIKDIPKSGKYWVTREYGFDTLVEKIRWSDAWKCWVDEDDDSVITKESAEIITAYMPYVVPEPYKKGE